VRSFQTKSLTRIRGAIDRLPWSGPLFLASVLALCALPPFGLFRSEFEIVAGGVDSTRDVPTAILVVLVTLAFLGLLGAVARLVLTPASTAPAASTARGREPSVWMVTPVLVGVLALLLLGVHPPADLDALLRAAAGQLGGVVAS
jgi:hydrogenase-4 component F